MTAQLCRHNICTSRPISRILSSAVIYLVLSLPINSSDVWRTHRGKRPHIGTFLSCFGWGLHCPLRYRKGGEPLPRLFNLTAKAAVPFCCTFPEVAFGGRYPSPCFVKFGLSSWSFLPATAQPTRCIIITLFFRLVNRL